MKTAQKREKHPKKKAEKIGYRLINNSFKKRLPPVSSCQRKM